MHMRKSVKLLLLSLMAIVVLAGCSKADFTNKKDKILTQTSNTKAVDNTAKMTAAEAEKLDDDKLIQSITKYDESVNLNDIDLQDEINSIDDILSDKDPLADIPKDISLGK